MLRPLLIISILILFGEISRAQLRGQHDNIENISRPAGEVDTIAYSEQSNLKPQKELGLENQIGIESRPDYRSGGDLSRNFNYETGTEKYLASFRIADILWPGNPGSRPDDQNDIIVIGVKKPDYRISRNPYIKGMLDFRLGGSFFGVENKALITISYYLKTENSLEELSSTISFERLSFSLSIPFGKGK